MFVTALILTLKSECHAGYLNMDNITKQGVYMLALYEQEPAWFLLKPISHNAGQLPASVTCF